MSLPAALSYTACHFWGTVLNNSSSQKCFYHLRQPVIIKLLEGQKPKLLQPSKLPKTEAPLGASYLQALLTTLV
jgi:hypothetical protein